MCFLPITRCKCGTVMRGDVVPCELVQMSYDGLPHCPVPSVRSDQSSTMKCADCQKKEQLKILKQETLWSEGGNTCMRIMVGD